MSSTLFFTTFLRKIFPGILMISFASPIGATQTLELPTDKQLLLNRPDPARWFITEDGKPTERLITLLELDNLYDPNDTLAKIVEKTQKAWIQSIQGQNNKERTDYKDTEKQAEIRSKVEAIVQEIGLFDERKPALSHYKYGACLGATLGGVRNNLSLLIKEWQKGIRFDSLVFFTGERYLRNEPGKDDDIQKLLHPHESPLKLKEGWTMPENTAYKTEYDMCRLVWDQTEIPEDMKKALDGKVLFVDSPRPEGRERPGTKDCYVTWMQKYNPEPGTMLAPSHPIVWTYQLLAGENTLGDKYPLDTCAPAATPELRKKHQERIVSLVQDTAAKCLYELNQRKNY